MLKLNITWPLFFLLLFALFAWLIRDQSQPVAQPKPKRYTPRPVRPRAAERTQPSPRHKSPSMIIDIDGGDDGVNDYDAETARLDQEAGAAFFDSLSRHSSEPSVTMRKGAWQQ